MSALNASIFGVIAMVAVGGTDYAVTMKKHEGQAYSLPDHIGVRFNNAMSAFGLGSSAEAEEVPQVPVVCAKKGAAKFCSPDN